MLTTTDGNVTHYNWDGNLLRGSTITSSGATVGVTYLQGITIGTTTTVE